MHVKEFLFDDRGNISGSVEREATPEDIKEWEECEEQERLLEEEWQAAHEGFRLQEQEEKELAELEKQGKI